MTILRVNTIAGTGTTFGPTLEGNLEFNSQNYIVLPKGSSTQEGVLRTTADVVGTGGTFYDNLVLAMPFNAATGLTDVSSRNRNPAAYGNVAISTAQSKYYGSSAYFDGNGDYLSIGSSNDFSFGTGNFTVEAWVYQTADNVYPTLFEIGNHLTSSGIIFITRSGGNAQIYSGGFYGAVSFSLNQWNHLAFVRSSGNLLIFVNGVLGSTTAFSNNLTDTSYVVSGFSLSPVSTSLYWFTGYLQDLRIYKGIAKYTANFTPPDRIAEIGVGFKAGQLRYNTDSNKVELYDGNQWVEVQSSRPDLNGGARGVFGGGLASTPTLVRVNTIEYITISSTGNAQDFGDLSAGKQGLSACSNSTRGIFGGGVTPTPALTYFNTIEYITISSTGNAQDFGDLSAGKSALTACSSSTRGVFGGGYTPTPAATVLNTIEYITISSTGNSQDFGDLSVTRNVLNACSNSTRGVFGGGSTPTPAATFFNVIEYITISSTGNAQDFGDLSIGKGNMGVCSSSTRGVFGGGYTPTPAATRLNVIEYITISTQGNVVDFGDLIESKNALSAFSNAHGGL